MLDDHSDNHMQVVCGPSTAAPPIAPASPHLRGAFIELTMCSFPLSNSFPPYCGAVA